jgi:glutamate/tyrosine decarboxylase-like PLP-dependent enzyme
MPLCQPVRNRTGKPWLHRRRGAGLCPGPDRTRACSGGPFRRPQSGGSQGSGPAPVLVCLQAGNLRSGAFDPFTGAIAVSKAHGAWVHVDGAFGLWATAVPELAGLTAGVERADSWATDAHKSLNVPYDCGVVVVRDAQALRSAMGLHASYLLQDADGSGSQPAGSGAFPQGQGSARVGSA